MTPPEEKKMGGGEAMTAPFARVVKVNEDTFEVHLGNGVHPPFQRFQFDPAYEIDDAYDSSEDAKRFAQMWADSVNGAHEAAVARAVEEAVKQERESHAWEISPAMAQAKIDELNAKIESMEAAKDMAVREAYERGAFEQLQVSQQYVEKVRKEVWEEAAKIVDAMEQKYANDHDDIGRAREYCCEAIASALRARKEAK